ncbi:hypothetical protein M3Y98_00384900 [Aphelenchoides besseyi]|nr:hypothetical protein M3Y98_00384900 [Aphelenchoides besseyi]
MFRSTKEKERNDDDYIRQVYGDSFDWFWKSDENLRFMTEREYWRSLEQKETRSFERSTELTSVFDTNTDSSIQCDLVTGEFDPKALPYKKYVEWHLRRFCYKTSAHGIPQIGQAKNKLYRITWILLFVCCMIMLYYNAKSVIEKYNRNEKIVDIELKFDTAAFPAITICNLNPYKASMTKDVELIKRTLSAFDGAMNKAGVVDEERSERVRRMVERDLNVSSVFEPGYSKCYCEDLHEEVGEIDDVVEEKGECQGDRFKWDRPEETDTKCICAFDRSTNDAWPCYPAEKWSRQSCDRCDARAFCKKSVEADEKTTNQPCICAPSGDFCMAYDGVSAILEIWKYLNGEPQVEEAEFVEAMGFTGMTDEVAIVTKAKENLIFAMSALSMQERMLLSNSKRELIHKCSFNGKACDIDNDFLTHVDPIFGSCFTYNHDRNTTLSSVRAGPMYGLRMLVYVNASEYMPTTEATGVRLTIHDQAEFPFPAPTGFVSSFGLRLRRMTRLPTRTVRVTDNDEPQENKFQADCVVDATTDNYIYRNYVYSVEGCYRSCFQHMVLKACKCGDPRFPVPRKYVHCRAADSAARKCLDEKFNELGGHQGSMPCKCQQPCKQSLYSVTYSPARWPSKSLQIQLGSCNATPAECTLHYKNNGAMIEVFYEQLNFELLTESEAYGLVNLLADFGGQLGLWCGISFLTCCEFVFLILEMIYISIQHRILVYRQSHDNT